MPKKDVTQTSSREVRVWIAGVSKAALADLAIDLLRRAHGEGIDGTDLLTLLRQSFEPMAVARGDQQP